MLEYDNKGKVTGVRTTMVDITDRKKTEDELQASLGMLKKTINDTIFAMIKIVETRDPYTAGHQKRVAELACHIAREMKLEHAAIEAIEIASLIHDIGKIYVPAEILSKPGRLSDIEYSLNKTHAKLSYDILKNIEFPWPIARIVLQHHERLDGSGYPYGISGNEILLEAHILAVADVVEAMTSHRPYRSSLGVKTALKEIKDARIPQ
jgi:putative nucleotidyltransferase with HDIG domain